MGDEAPGIKCSIWSGASAAVAQMALLGAVVAGLALKRCRERPRRLWKVWMLDVSKQGAGSGAAHLCSMAVAAVASVTAEDGTSQCAWYWVIFTLDTTAGTIITLLLHARMVSAARARHEELLMSQGGLVQAEALLRAPAEQTERQRRAALAASGQADPLLLRGRATPEGGSTTGGGSDVAAGGEMGAAPQVQLPVEPDGPAGGSASMYKAASVAAPAAEAWWVPVGESGNYGEPPQLWRWGVQLAAWLAATMVGRVACSVLVVAGVPLLRWLALGLDWLLGAHPQAELMLVMVAWPLLLNVAQAWVQDTALKWRQQHGGADEALGSANLDSIGYVPARSACEAVA